MELLSFIISSIVLFLFLFGVMFVYMFFKNLRKFQRERELQELDSDKLKQSIMVYVEKQNVDGYYRMYDAISNFFIAQGKDESELWERAQLRCPDMNIILGNVTVENGNITVSTSKIKGDL